MNLQAKLHTTTTDTMAFPSAARRPALVRWITGCVLAGAVVVGVAELNSLRSDIGAPSKGGVRQTKVEPLLTAEEKAFIDRVRRGPIASVAGRVALRPSRFVPLVIAEEQAFIDGDYSHGPAVDWCVGRKPC
jgi:hypothetical protein